MVRAVHNLTLACYKRNTNGDQQKDGHVLYRAVPVTAFCCSADYHAAQRQSHTLPRCTTSLPHISTLQNVTPTHIHAAQRHSHTLPRCAMSIPHISTLHNVTITHNHAARHPHTTAFLVHASIGRSSFAPAFVCGYLIQNCWYSLYSYPVCFYLFKRERINRAALKKNSTASLNFAIAVPTSFPIYLSEIHFTIHCKTKVTC